MRLRRQIQIGGLALFACVAVAACGADQQPNPVGPTPPAPSTTVTIDIAEMNGPNSFYPSPGSVGAGQTVVWRNGDRLTHHVVFDAIQVDAGTTAPGTSSQPIAVAAGTWTYHCAIHPSMVGTLTVAGSDSTPTPAPY
jgi:plastocyanin